MKTDPRRFAWLGLVLSALAVISFFLVIIVRGLASAGIYQPQDAQLLDKALWVCLAVFVLGIALTAFIDPEGTRRFLLGRQLQHGSNAFIMLAAFLGILFFINLLAYQNPRSWDLTENQQNTLAPETIAMLKALPAPVTAKAYYSTSVSSSEALKLLESYKQSGGENFSFELIDPEANPVAAQQDGVDRDGTIVLLMADRKEQVSFADEESLDTALIRLINPEKRVVTFLTGHGEADTLQTENNTYSLIRTTLQNKNYSVDTLNLGSVSQVPADVQVVVVAGPQTPLTQAEVTALQSFLEKGGALIVMQEPRGLTKIGDAVDPLAELLASWGITQQNDIIYDPNANPPLLVYADPLSYGQHATTEKLRGVNSRFFTAQSFALGTPAPEITLTPLAVTYPEAWGETDLASIEGSNVAFDQAVDLAGPLTLAVAAENYVTRGRLVVFGDSEFATNTLYQAGNGEILLNAIDWATRQEQLISLTPKNNVERTYNPPGSTGLIGIILVSLCALPMLIIAGGLATWYSRRKKG